MSRPSDLTNFFAGSIVRKGFKPQAPSNATAITGAGIDRFDADNAWALCARAVAQFAYTAASGDGTGVIDVLVEVITSDSSNLASPTVLASETFRITWVSDAAKENLFAVEAALQGAKRYVGVRFTETKGGTITVSSPLASAVLELGGLQKAPSGDYIRGGYAETTDTLSFP